MRVAPLLCLLFLCLWAQKQQAQVGFNLRYDHSDSLWAEDAPGIELHDSGYLIFSGVGYEDSVQNTNTIGSHLISPMGQLIWQKIYYRYWKASFPGWANVADRTTDGGYVTGGTSVEIGQPSNIYLVRYNSEADTLWTRTFGDGVEDWIGYSLKQTLDGGFILVGSTGASGFIDGVAIKTDSLGNEEWTQFYGGGGADYIVAVDNVPGSGYYLGGQFRQSIDNKDLWVHRVDSIGNVLWVNTWGTTFDEPNAHLMAASDGHCVVAAALGYADDFLQTRPYMAKLDSADGSILWEHEYGPVSFSTGVFAVKECTNTDYIASGATHEGIGGERGLLLRTNNQGDSLWMRYYYYADTTTGITQGRGRFWDVIQTPDLGFIACGRVRGDTTSPGYSQDTWVVKVDSMGCIVPGCDSTGVGITEQVTNLTDAIKVWPNPVMSGGVINVQLELLRQCRGKELRLAVVSSDGRLVHEQVLDYARTDNPSTLNLQLSTGPYFIHLTDGTRWLSGTKFIVE